MAKFNYTNPNSTILEAFTDEWPEPVEDVDNDLENIIANDSAEAAIADDLISECDGKDCDKSNVLKEADDEDEIEVEETEEAEEEPVADEAEAEVEETSEEEAQPEEVESEEAETEEIDNISTDDFLAQIRTVFDDNMNKLDDVPEEDQEKFAAFNDGLNRAFDLIKDFLQPEEEEEEEEATEGEAEETEEVTDIEVEDAPVEIKLEFPEE